MLLSHFFFKKSPSLAYVCSAPSFFVSWFTFDWFKNSTTFVAVLIVEFILGLLLLWLFNNIYKWVFFILCAVIFCNTDYHCFVCNFNL